MVITERTSALYLVQCLKDCHVEKDLDSVLLMERLRTVCLTSVTKLSGYREEQVGLCLRGQVHPKAEETHRDGCKTCRLCGSPEDRREEADFSLA